MKYNNFLSEYDLGYCYIILKNEIFKAHLLSESIVDYVKIEFNNIEKPNFENIVEGTIIEKIY